MIDVICVDRSGAIYRPCLRVCVTDVSLCTRCAGVFRQEDIVLPALSALLPDHKSCERRCLHFSVWWVLSLFLYFPVKPRPFSHFQATKGSGWGSRLNVWPVPHPINPAVLPPHYQNPCCHHNESKHISFNFNGGRFLKIFRLTFICQFWKYSEKQHLKSTRNQNGPVYFNTCFWSSQSLNFNKQ